MTETMKQYLKAYENLKQDRKDNPSWFLRLREEAMTSLAQKGFPTTQDDTWRYTDVAAIRETSWELDATVPNLPKETVETLKRKNGKNFLLIINGKFSREHSSIEKGVEVTDLEEAIVSRPGLVEAHLGRHAVPGRDAFSDLNTGLLNKGLFIRIPENMTVREPIHMVFLAHASGGRSLFQVRNLILAEKKSKATIVETYAAEDGKSYFTNALTEIVLEEGARMEHCKVVDFARD